MTRDERQQISLSRGPGGGKDRRDGGGGAGCGVCGGGAAVGKGVQSSDLREAKGASCGARSKRSTWYVVILPVEGGQSVLVRITKATDQLNPSSALRDPHRSPSALHSPFFFLGCFRARSLQVWPLLLLRTSLP